MDKPPQGVPGGPAGAAAGLADGLSDDERERLGAQQAAMIQLQAVKDIELQEKAIQQQQLMAVQQQALVTRLAEQQQQQQQQQQQLQQLQLQAAAESQKEEELKRLQIMALVENEKEKQLMQPAPVIQAAQLSTPAPPLVMMNPPLAAPPQLSGLQPVLSSAMFTRPQAPAMTTVVSQPEPVITQQSSQDKPRPLMSIETQPPQRKLLGEDNEEEDGEGSSEFKLPQALEKVLAFKDARAQQVGVKPEDIEKVEKGEVYPEGEESPTVASTEWRAEYDEADDDEEEEPKPPPAKESKNKKRKKKKKRAKQRRIVLEVYDEPEKKDEDEVNIEYVSESLDLNIMDPSYREFSKIFDKFKIVDIDKEREMEAEQRRRQEEKEKAERPSFKVKNVLSDEEMEEEDDDEVPHKDSDEPKLSKKKMKKLNRLSVAELKQLVCRPDVVEMHDVTARDPKLLVNLKATRNTVPVPRHWCFKRKYLQGKRGIEKTPFQLPAFIRETGIEDMRAALQEKEEQKNLKAKMRERVRPKMGKIDIDYQKLHDAFFRYQTKPKMTIHGDLYYEGKEFETRLKEKKPGNLSDDLRTALGMPLGANADKYPPPWLIAMQRYGPPPSYPNLKIPGLNAPIPDSCSFGYHAGGWGKPPVDEAGKPLYGDVFGTQTQEVVAIIEDEEIDRTRWGELESESEEEEEEEEEEEDEGEEPDSSGLVTPGDTGLVTPSGVTSVPIGVETPDMIELRKKRIEDAMDQGGDTPALYTVLPEKKVSVGSAMMGSTHVYDVAGAIATGTQPGARKAGPGTAVAVGAPAGAAAAVTVVAAGGGGGGEEGIELALNPDELDLDQAAIQAKYDQQMREQQSHLAKEDLSDMVAEHAAKQKKRKKQQQDQGKAAKKYKDFKF